MTICNSNPIRWSQMIEDVNIVSFMQRIWTEHENARQELSDAYDGWGSNGGDSSGDVSANDVAADSLLVRNKRKIRPKVIPLSHFKT